MIHKFTLALGRGPTAPSWSHSVNLNQSPGRPAPARADKIKTANLK